MKKSTTANSTKSTNNQQQTLLHFWRGSSSSNLLNENQNGKPAATAAAAVRKDEAKKNDMVIFDDNNGDDDDDDLQMILASESVLKEKSMNQTTTSTTSFKFDLTRHEQTIDGDDPDKIAVGIDEQAVQSTQHFDTSGFDREAGSVWIYPNNMPTRSYQYNIIEQCLHKNTMVVLPTGLGKTFVAAVVMFNFYRWYPNGKVIFMAPTKPLVNQQSEACYNIVGINKNDMTQMTGQMAIEKRKNLWATKRVFFLTPQIISNDIIKGDVDVNLIKCVVLDEAHKALGEYAFCKVIKSISDHNKNFRIIALTATPGSDVKTVQGIIDKLLISHIEVRSDESIDIQQYNHTRVVDKFVLPLSDYFVQVKNSFLNLMRSPLKRLEMNRVMSIKDPSSLNKLMILTRRDEFRRNPPPGLDAKRASFVECDLALLVSLVHALELLTQYGLKSFYMFLKSFVDNSDGTKSTQQQNKLKTEIKNCAEVAELFEKLRSFDDPAAIIPKTLRHPKLLKLEELVLEHFRKFEKTDTRIMIFSQYRESVYEITSVLAAHDGVVKPMEFVGQSTNQGSRKSVTQKEQLSVVKKFREGGFNTLVSTCVGEEGLDIGEVDLIICYDSQKSPIRLIQRMGRTGRKREGRIIILLTQGKEEQSYQMSLSKKNNIYKIIQNGKKNFTFYANNPLMIPKGLRPRCEKKFIELPAEEQVETKKKKANNKQQDENMDVEDVENDEDVMMEEIVGGKKKQAAKKKEPKKKATNKKKMDDSDSFELPDLDLNFEVDKKVVDEEEAKIDFGFLKATTNSEPQQVDAKEEEKPKGKKPVQLKLITNAHVLNLKQENKSSSIVAEPPDTKKLNKMIRNVPKSLDLSTIELENDSLRMDEEDDFLIATNNIVDASLKLDEQPSIRKQFSELEEKFSEIYLNLVEKATKYDDQMNSTAVKFDKSYQANNNNEMIIDDTVAVNEPSASTSAYFNMSSSLKPKLESASFNTQETNRSCNMSKLNPIPEKLVVVAAEIKEFKTFETNLDDLFPEDEEDDEDKYLMNIDEQKLIECKRQQAAKESDESKPKTTIDPKKSTSTPMSSIVKINNNNNNTSPRLSCSLAKQQIQEIKEFKTFETNLEDLFPDEDEDDKMLMNFDEKKLLENKQPIKCQQPTEIVIHSPGMSVKNSTSTPMRSILKKSHNSPLTNHNNNNNNLYINSLKKSLNVNSNLMNSDEIGFKATNESMVGMTQAINLLNCSSSRTPLSSTKALASSSATKRSAQKVCFIVDDEEKKSIRPTFDMKSNLDDLFSDDNNSYEENKAIAEIKNTSGSEIIVLNNPKETKASKNRKLCFDEISIMETSNYKVNREEIRVEDDASELGETQYWANKKKNRNVLSSSTSGDDSDLIEVIGSKEVKPRNYMEKFAADYMDDDEDFNNFLSNYKETNHKEDTSREHNWIRRDKKIQKRIKSNLVLEEVDESSDDELRSSDETENSAENEYDLKDSIIDSKNYSVDESMMAKYRESLKSPNDWRKNIYNRKLKPISDEIFSQMPEQDETYEHDSFVVADDYVSFVNKKKSRKKKGRKEYDDDDDDDY